MTSLALVITALTLAATAVLIRSAPPTLIVTSLASPAAADSGQPQLTVSDRGVLLSWVEKAGPRATLKFAERTSSGWTAPRVVASGDDWFVNWADVPSVLRLSGGSLAAHWLQKSGPDTYAYDVRLSYSADEGKSWAPSFMPHHDATKTEHGFASLFEVPGGGLGLVWLDGRAMKGDHGGGGGAMSVRFATFDSSWKQTADMPIDLRVCECCPTTAVMTPDGPIAAFRNRSDEEIRDIYVARYEGGQWSEPRSVHDDGWKIPACPVNGPMLSARGRDVAIAWFSVAEEQGRAYVAFSKDAGRTFGSAIRLDERGSLGRVDVELMPDGSAIATWIEFADQRAQFQMRRVEPSGTKSPPVTVTGLAGNRTSGYPRIAGHGEEMVLAWTESSEGRLQVKTAAARVAGATER